MAPKVADRRRLRLTPRRHSHLDGDDGVVDETVVRDHGVVAEQREVDCLRLTLPQRPHVIGVVDDGELLALHLVALARAEGGHRLVRLALSGENRGYFDDRHHVHRLLGFHLGDVGDGHEVVVLHLDALVVRHCHDLRYASDRYDVGTSAMGGEFVLVVQRVVGTLGVADFEVGEVVHLAHLQIRVEQVDRFAEERDANFAALLVLDVMQ